MISRKDTASDRLFRLCVLGTLPFLVLQRYVPPLWAVTEVATLFSFFFFLEFLKSRLTNYTRLSSAPLSRSLSDFVHRVSRNGIEKIATSEIEIGDALVFSQRDLILADGRIIEGVALVDESALTGESAAVVREAENSRSFVSEGSRVLSGQVTVEVTQLPKSGFKLHIHQLLTKTAQSKSFFEKTAFQKSTSLSLMLVIACILVVFFVPSSSFKSGFAQREQRFAFLTLFFLASLLVVWLLPFFHRLLSLSFLDRLLHRHLIPKDIDALEKAGDIDLILTSSERETKSPRLISVKELISAPQVKIEDLARLAQLAALCDDDPNERAIITFVKDHFRGSVQSLTGKSIRFITAANEFDVRGVHIFNEDGEDGMRAVLIGPLISIRRHIEGLGRLIPDSLIAKYESILNQGDEALFVCDGAQAAGLIHLSKRTTDPHDNAVSIFQNLEIRLAPVALDRSKIDAVIEARQHQTSVAYLARDEGDLGAMQEADLSLSTNFANEALNQVADVVSLNGDIVRYKYLFILGRELLAARGTLNRIAFSIASAVWLVLIPLVILIVSGKREFSWLLNPLNLGSQTSALFACSLAALIALSGLGVGILGLHDHRGQLFRFGRSTFGSGSAPAKFFIATVVMTKGLDLFLGLLN